ncbi:uncharacterized protein LOC116847514 [Odontomachus brunneus]|uniref:uncharacterized protein LOC116847514 n=1 Tax=Odontomachus brunneus TaxID=486640 RepID=UPI0013F264FD|nr:uncharacterized protein LOC116847514 [Odontomachus brunneus]
MYASADKLFKRHRIVVHVRDPKMSVKETLNFLDRQNGGLAASEWIVARGSESKNAASSPFSALTGDRMLEVLKDLNFKPFCGLGQVTVKVASEKEQEGRFVFQSSRKTESQISNCKSGFLDFEF